MKTPARQRDVISTMQGEQIKMSIDNSAFEHIMSILTDLYSDPEMAVLREYATNARDAHIEAGVSLPIEVTLPTSLSPYLKIRDFGGGLDAEDIREIYSRYGASTKRDTDEQVGSLGLGCKSALTYTDQFTVQGIKNGVCVQVVVSREESGAGSMTLVAEYETDEANGVEITVPVKAYHSFEEKASYLFQFWPEGTVLVNGEEPKHFEGVALDDTTYIVDRTILRDSVVVMGGVPYKFTNDDSYYYSVVAFVEMGAVQFTPSREDLQMTAKTTAVIQDIEAKVVNLKQTAIERDVNQAETKPEALQRALNAASLFRYNGDLTYKGKTIPDSIDSKGQEHAFTVVRKNKGRRYYGERMISQHSTLSTSLFPKSLFFTGFKTKSINPTQREKLKIFIQENGIDLTEVEQYIFVDTLPYASWVEKDRIFDWEAVKAIKLPKTGGTTADGRPMGAYDAIMPDTSYTQVVEASDLLDEPHLFYFGYGEHPSKQREVIRDQYPDAVFVELKSNRIAKFQRVFPQAREIYPAAQEIGQAWFDGLTTAERRWLSVSSMSLRDELALLDHKEIDDPVLSEIVKLAGKKKDNLYQKARRYYGMYDGEFEEIDFDEHYPLANLDRLSYYSYTASDKAVLIQHITLYLNAVYAAGLNDSTTGTAGDDKETN